MQLPRRSSLKHSQLDVDDFHHVPVCWLWRHRSQHVLRTRHFRLHRSHGTASCIYFKKRTLARTDICLHWQLPTLSTILRRRDHACYPRLWSLQRTG